jgi:hypothetical protein
MSHVVRRRGVRRTLKRVTSEPVVVARNSRWRRSEQLRRVCRGRSGDPDGPDDAHGYGLADATAPRRGRPLAPVVVSAVLNGSEGTLAK